MTTPAPSSAPTPARKAPMSTFDTPEAISLTIELAVGDVRIRAGDGTTTVVGVRPSDATSDDDRKLAERTRVEYADGQLLIRADKLTPRLRSWLGPGTGPSVDVTVELPAGSRVDATLGLADLHADGRLGDCRLKIGLGRTVLDQVGRLELKSGAGDVSVGRVGGSAEVHAGSGDLRVQRIDAGAVLKNTNGDSWVGSVAGDLRVRAANGDIAVGLAEAGVDARSANGDIRLGEIVRGSIVLETPIGELEVGVREGTAAWLDVRAKTGKLRNALDVAASPASSTETAEIRARTTVGDIVIRRPSPSPQTVPEEDA